MTTLKPLTDQKYSGMDTAMMAHVGRMVSGFAKWVDAGHPYRHAQGASEIQAPSFELAVMYLNTGAGFVRWLAESAPTESNHQRTANPSALMAATQSARDAALDRHPVETCRATVRAARMARPWNFPLGVAPSLNGLLLLIKFRLSCQPILHFLAR